MTTVLTLLTVFASLAMLAVPSLVGTLLALAVDRARTRRLARMRVARDVPVTELLDPALDSAAAS